MIKNTIKCYQDNKNVVFFFFVNLKLFLAIITLYIININ